MSRPAPGPKSADKAQFATPAAAAAAAADKRLASQRRGGKKRPASPTVLPGAAAAASEPKRFHRAHSDEAQVVENIRYAAVYQPKIFVTDDDEENNYVPCSPVLMDLQIVWTDATKKRGRVTGDLLWNYGLFWAHPDALERAEKMHWAVATQSERVTGDAAAHYEPHHAHPLITLSLRTQRLNVIDTTGSAVGEGADEPEREVIDYSLERFECDRTYHLHTNPTAPHQMLGTIAALAPSHQVEQNEDGDEETDTNWFPETRVQFHRLPPSMQAKDFDALESPLAITRHFSEQKTNALKIEFDKLDLSLDRKNTLLKILVKIVEDPTEDKYRRINYKVASTKWPDLVAAFPLFGFQLIQDETDHVQRFVWGDDQDLLHLCDIYRLIISSL